MNYPNEAYISPGGEGLLRKVIETIEDRRTKHGKDTDLEVFVRIGQDVYEVHGLIVMEKEPKDGGEEDRPVGVLRR